MSYQETLHPQMETGKKSLRAYIIGFASCLIFTLCAFGAVQFEWFDASHRYVALALLAVSQLFIQSVCFLGLNASKKGWWDLFPFLFVLMVITFLVGGSLWIMYNLNFNMLTV